MRRDMIAVTDAAIQMYALHRAAGRVMLLGIWLHSVGKVLSGSNFEAMHAKAALVGLICFTLTFILSLGPIRKFWYEWFLASHCILIAYVTNCI